MRNERLRALTAGTIAALLVAACAGSRAAPSAASTATPVPSPGTSAGPGPAGSTPKAVLRTYPVASGQTICPMFVLRDAVSGVLAGSSGDPLEPIWLRAPDGARISIVWPAGFTVRFQPKAILYDAHGRAVAAAGDSVTLPQVAVGSRRGTYDHPYLATGLLFGGCYTPVG